MPTATDRDLYQRFELEVRTPSRRLLVDAFLPAPDALPSAVSPLPPPPPTIFQTDELGALARLDLDAEPEPKPKPRKRAAAPKKKKEAEVAERPLSLQEEIAEFMGRGRSALVPDEDAPAPQPSQPAAPAPPVIPDDPSGSDPENGS